MCSQVLNVINIAKFGPYCLAAIKAELICEFKYSYMHYCKARETSRLRAGRPTNPSSNRCQKAICACSSESGVAPPMVKNCTLRNQADLLALERPQLAVWSPASFRQW